MKLMTSRSIARCAGVLMLFGFLASAEALGPLTLQKSLNLGSRAHDLVLSEDGTLAYVATDLGLRIVRLDPANASAQPVLVGSLNILGRSLGIALKGSHVFIAGMSADLKVVNVSNPAAPVLAASRAIAGYAWDVAIKDDVAYVSTFTGQVYLFDIEPPTSPQQIDVIGLPAWTAASGDATNLARLNNYVTTGNAKVSGVSVSGNNLFAVDWNYGRLYYYDVTDARVPIFRGTHYAPFLLNAEGNPDGSDAYALSAYGSTSGIYSVTLSTLGPSFSTRYTSCTGCDYFRSPTTDFGGLTVTSNGKYVVYIAGKVGEVRVLDVTNPADIKSVGVLPLGAHYSRTGESMGVRTRGNAIYTAAGLLGLQVYTFPGLSD